MLDSNEAEFVAVYGRRRVGKTYLIRKFFKNKQCLFFQTSGVKNRPQAAQLSEFNRAVETTFYGNVRRGFLGDEHPLCVKVKICSDGPELLGRYHP